MAAVPRESQLLRWIIAASQPA